MKWMKTIGILVVTVSLFGAASAVAGGAEGEAEQGRWIDAPGKVLPQRDRIDVVNRVLADRLENLLPSLMRETGIDMWLVINREYAEDPVYFSLVPQPTFAARRTTMLMFHDRGEGKGVDRLTVNRYPLGELYEAAWEGGDLDEQWQALADLIAERDPKRIGVDISRHWPAADGLTAGLHQRLLDVLPENLKERVVPAEDLVVRWIETRSQLELEHFPHIVAIARGVITEAFSERVITPGVTTTDDVRWYIRERFSQLELPIWFMPSVDVQRGGEHCDHDTFCGLEGDTVILRGDVLHTDVGICYLRLCTDNQEMGYVLRLGESEVPEELVRALRLGNRWQDILTGSFETGRSGNEILAATIVGCEKEELSCMTYTHPLGVFGHSMGPTIGMWDNQGETPVRGDWQLHAMTSYAIEGNVKVPLQLWEGQPVLIKLEQGAVYDGDAVHYLGGRQTEWHIVR